MSHRHLADVVSRAEKFLAQGEPLLAYDAASAGLTESPNDVRLRQLRGLVLARSGATQRANAVLEKSREENRADEEALGMLGRTFKDLAANAERSGDRKKFLYRAAEIYGDAYQSTGSSGSLSQHRIDRDKRANQLDDCGDVLGFERAAVAFQFCVF
jgi:hypothetical protein